MQKNTIAVFDLDKTLLSVYRANKSPLKLADLEVEALAIASISSFVSQT